MANINGIQLRTLQAENPESSIRFALESLYLGTTKLGTAILESEDEQYPASLQLLLQYGYSEKKLRALLEQENGPGYTPEKLVRELKWMNGLEQEFMKHMGARNAGLLSLSLEGAQVNLGIPFRFAGMEDEAILDSLGPRLDELQRTYGPLNGYLIFRSPSDFTRGRVFTEEELRD